MVDLPNARIVIIERNMEQRHLLIGIFKQAGAKEIADFHDVVGAVNFLRHKPVDLILAENDLQKMTGVEFARLLRDQIPMNKEAGLMLVMVRPTGEMVKAAIAAGASNIAVKPISTEDLLKRAAHTLAHTKNPHVARS